MLREVTCRQGQDAHARHHVVCPKREHSLFEQVLQAMARQQKFEQSAGGRAAMKAVREVQQERQAPKQAGGKDTAADWLT